MAVSFTVRGATTTNLIGHGYVAGTDTYSGNRYFTSFDLTGWDEASSANFNGPTADGSITRTWTGVDDPGTPIIT